MVQCIKKTFTISKPAAIVGNWDLHIHTMPEHNTPYIGGGQTAVSGITTLNEDGLCFNNPTWTNVEPNTRLSPLMWTAVPTGLKTWPNAITDVPAASITRGYIDLNDYMSGNCRIIGGGFEVHNVTEKLSVKGTCTVYRQPQTYTRASLSYMDRITATDGNYTNYVPPPQFAVISRLPPATAEDAMILPHSKQWNAEWGSYQVFTTDFDQSNTTQFGIRHFGFSDFHGGQSTGVVGDGVSLLPGLTYGMSRYAQNFSYTTAPVGIKNTTPFCAPFKVWPVDTTGSFYTGLGDTTVLTVTAIFILETFPTQASPLVTLATPPPAYDPNFFRLYKTICLAMPPGVMVAENASGDWWKKVITFVGDAASALPGVGMVSKPLASAIIRGIDGLRTTKQSTEEKKAQTAQALRSAANNSKKNITYTDPKTEKLEHLKVTRPSGPPQKGPGNWKQMAKNQKK